MKNEAKKIALIFSSVILAVCFALNVVACVVSGDGSISEESSSDQTDPEINEGDSQYPSSDDTEETDDKIVNVEVNNLDIYYLPTSTIDFDAVTLTVTFDDGSTEVLTEKEYDIDDKDAAEDTEFILGTDGLYAVAKEAEAKGEELKKGDYEITYSIPSYKKSGKFYTVTVGDDYRSDLQPLYYSDPDFLSDYKYRCDEVTSRSGDEDTFFESPQKYYVGDDNEFIFEPTLIVTNTKTGEVGTFSDYKKELTVTLTGEDGDSTNLDITDYLDGVDGFGIDFSETAVGKTFTITAMPPDDMTLLYGGAFGTVSMDVTVADGWNVYSALDLGMMNITGSGFNRSEYTIDGDIDQQLTDFFWDGKTSTYVTKYTDEIWSEFLEEKGYDISSPVNGMFLHGDIYVTADDVPEDFVITKSEARPFGCDYEGMIGSMRFGVNLYQKYLEDDDFTLDGNLFTVDCSALKCAMTYIDETGHFKYYTESTTSGYKDARLSLFAVQGKVSKDIAPGKRPVATFKNLRGIGNSRDENDVDGKDAGSYSFIDSLASKTVVKNCHARKFLYGFRAADSDESYVNLTISHSKVYDCYFGAMRISRAARNEVYNSEFKRFSGPAIYQMSETKERGTAQFGGYYECGITIDEKSVLENYIDEIGAWFVSSDTTYIPTYISLFDSFVRAYSGCTKTVITDEGINLRAVQHDTEDFGAGGRRLNTSYKTGDGVAFVLNETTLTPAEGGGHVETLDEDFNGDLSLYNAASLNYFVDGVSTGIHPLPLLFCSNGGTLVAIDNSYIGFYNPAALRDNNGVAIEGEKMSFEATADELYIYYRIGAVSGNDGAGVCFVLELFDI